MVQIESKSTYNKVIPAVQKPKGPKHIHKPSKNKITQEKTMTTKKISVDAF